MCRQSCQINICICASVAFSPVFKTNRFYWLTLFKGYFSIRGGAGYNFGENWFGVLVNNGPVSGLGSKMGFDATNKWPAETQREWGRPIAMTKEIKNRVDEILEKLDLKN